MRVFLESKYKSLEILARRQEMIEKEKLHIQDGLSYERIQELYGRYGEGLEEKEFACAFLDIDDVKYFTVSSGKPSQTAILSRQYVSKEEFKSIREQLIELYGLETISYNKAVEYHEKFGRVLSFDLFVEEILGIDRQVFKGKKLKTRNPDREIPVNFDIEAGEYSRLNGTEEMPMYVLNPNHILELRNKIVYEAGLHIEESIDYEKFTELYNRYGKDMTEVAFAQEVLDISAKSLNNIKTPKKFSTMILQNVTVPERYILELRDKIALLNKLEGGQLLEYSKITEFHQKYATEFSERRFAVDVLEVTNENYRPEGENSSVTILASRITNYDVLRNKMIKELNLHYDDMIDYSKFTLWHQRFAPNMPEVTFAENILDITKSNFKEVKYDNGRARILLNMKLPSKEQMNEIRRKIILENNFHIMDEIGYEQLVALHSRYGGIMSLEIFATEVLLMREQASNALRRDYEENKDKEDVKLKKAYILLNYEIPIEELEELKRTIKKNENLENPRMMSREEIDTLYKKYGGIMTFHMFLREVLSVDPQNYENLKYERHKQTLVQIRESLNEEEIKEVKRLLVQDLSEREIATQMEMPVAFLSTNLKKLYSSEELSAENLLYERIKMLSDEGATVGDIARKLEINRGKVAEMLSRYKKEKSSEEKRRVEAERQKKIDEREQRKKEEIEKRARRAVDDCRMTEKSIKNVREYITECYRSFKEGKFQKRELDFLAECLTFIQCKSTDIEMFSKICIQFYAYNMASMFIAENIDNDGISKEERTKLCELRENINYAIKKDMALHLIQISGKDAKYISEKTGVSEVDVIKLKRSVERNIGTIMNNRIRPGEDDGQYNNNYIQNHQRHSNISDTNTSNSYR